MPTITRTERVLFAHCRMPICPGYRQEEVQGLETETAWAFVENGGDIPGTERSHVEYHFADDADRVCATCGRDRELTASPRPSYDPLSGFDPMGLLNVARFDPQVMNAPEDARVAELEAKVDQLIAALKDGG